MTLVNTTGMALFGPGSEWLWAMLQFLALAITFIAIYRQVSAQRSVGVFQQMAAWEREWEDFEFRSLRLACLLELESRGLADEPSLCVGRVGDRFERLGYLVAQGHIRAADLYHGFGTGIIAWWAVLGPSLTRRRVAEGEHVYQWFESLAREMQRNYVQVHGRPYERIPTLEQLIQNTIESLRRQLDARNGVIPVRADPPVPGTAAGEG